MNLGKQFARLALSIAGHFACAAFASLVSLRPAYAAEEAPFVRVTVNSPGWITVDWIHTGQDVQSFRVQREQPAYTWVFETHIGAYTDKDLTADTVYKYRVCADYRDTTKCSEWLAARTMPPQAPTAPHPKPPPEVVGPGDAYHEPSRIRIRWKKTGDYERVIVRWRHQTGAGESQADIDSSEPEGSYEVLTPLPGTYVFLLKGCTLNIVGVANCGDWSAPVEIATAPPGVARVDCTPGTLKAGSPSFTASGRAEYHFENPIPTYKTPAGVCLGPARTVVASYLVHGVWNPTAQPGAWDSSGANATESFTMTFAEEFSPERAPRRPLPPGASDPTATISFLARAHCDRDPWLNPTATCRRTGDNVPQDVRAKWPALVTEPFPHSRNAIPQADRGRLLTHYNRITAQIVGTARGPSGSRAMEHASQRRTDDQNLRDVQMQQPMVAPPEVTFSPQPFIRGVLLVGRFRTKDELSRMPYEDQRNTLITELANRSNQPVGHFQSLNNVELAGAGAVLAFLREARIRDDATLKRMSIDDMRNTLIVEAAINTGLTGAQLQALSNVQLVRTALGQGGSLIRGVLLVGRFRTKDDLNRMSHDDQRNTLITELTNRSNQPVGHYQGLNDVDLAGVGAVLVLLREAAIRDDAALRTMSDDDMRNTLIVETAFHTRVPGGELQAMDNIRLVETALSDIRREPVR